MAIRSDPCVSASTGTHSSIFLGCTPSEHETHFAPEIFIDPSVKWVADYFPPGLPAVVNRKQIIGPPSARAEKA